MRQWLAFCPPPWAGTEVDPHRVSVSAFDFPASCTGEDVSAPWRCLALCFLGSVTTAYSGFREGLPSSSFRGSQQDVDSHSSCLSQGCLSSARESCTYTLGVGYRSATQTPETVGKSWLLEANTKQRSQTFLVDANQEMPKVNKCFFYLFRFSFNIKGFGLLRLPYLYFFS